MLWNEVFKNIRIMKYVLLFLIFWREILLKDGRVSTVSVQKYSFTNGICNLFLKCIFHFKNVSLLCWWQIRLGNL